MPENFLYDYEEQPERYPLDPAPMILREAPKPRRWRRWLHHYYWTVPSGLCFGFGLYAAYDGLRFTAGAFIAAGILIWAVFGGIE